MRIMIALDESKRAEVALGRVVPLLRASGGDLILLNVFSPSVEMGDAPGTTPEEHRTYVVAQRKAYLDSLARNVAGVRTETVVEARHKAEDADQCIARVAGERAVDVLVVTSKQAAGLSGLVLGSTAQGLLRVSPCPVLVVRPEAGARREGAAKVSAV